MSPWSRAASLPVLIADVLDSAGQSLEVAARKDMESRFGHDFSQVRVHADARAAESARALGAKAYTVGSRVIFGAGQYAPGSPSHARLLAHELSHVVQQRATTLGRPAALSVSPGRHDRSEMEADRAATAVVSGRSPQISAAQHSPVIQRQDTEEETLRWPGLGREPTFRLRLDPEIEAQARAAAYFRMFLSPDAIRLSIQSLDWDGILQFQPPNWLTAPPVPEPPPLVPRGAGPSEPRAANPGDVLRAVMRIPAVDSALTTLRTSAEDEFTRNWGRLSTGERALVITQTAIIGGGALAGVLSDPEARGFVLGLVENRTLPVPGVPGLTFQFNLTGPNQSVRFDLNVGALLPPSWGFR